MISDMKRTCPLYLLKETLYVLHDATIPPEFLPWSVYTASIWNPLSLLLKKRLVFIPSEESSFFIIRWWNSCMKHLPRNDESNVAHQYDAKVNFLSSLSSRFRDSIISLILWMILMKHIPQLLYKSKRLRKRKGKRKRVIVDYVTLYNFV